MHEMSQLCLILTSTEKLRQIHTEYVAQHLWFLIIYLKICSPNDVVKLDEPISSRSQVWTV